MNSLNDQLEVNVHLINNSLKLFGQKFAFHIVLNMLFLNQKRFSQFLKSIDGLNTKTLSIRLKDLEKWGIIERNVTQKRPIQVEYSLTEKGKALEQVLIKLVEFSITFETKTNFKDGTTVSR
jgi:DNA-binding HxlR family transcriptional regulator